jgi:eukaryotic-like serine/threonine-protein kinase
VTILKVPRLWLAFQVGRAATVARAAAAPAHAPADGLDAFGSESEPKPAPKVRIAPPPPSPRTPIKMPKWLPTAALWTAVIVATAAVAVAGVFLYQKRFAVTATSGTVTVETTPPGLEVTLAGKSLGKTPLTTTMAAGAYELQVGSQPNVRTVKVNVSAGSSIVQQLEFADRLTTAAASTGGLRVQTEPSRLPVFVDGTQRGVSPLALDQLATGEHEVSVRTSGGVVRRSVTIQPRETVSLIISSTTPPPTPGVAAGWITVTSSVPLQLREGGKLIGTSESDQVMLAAGDHNIEFTNGTLGFTARRKISVTAGKTTATKIDLPNGTLNINAQPWAEVFVDGERVGETPIGNLARPVGTHEVIFRHPDLGERKETVTITVGKPARIGVDLRKK